MNAADITAELLYSLEVYCEIKSRATGKPYTRRAAMRKCERGRIPGARKLPGEKGWMVPGSTLLNYFSGRPQLAIPPGDVTRRVAAAKKKALAAV